MTNDIKLELEDTETGAILTTTPSDDGVFITVEDDDNVIEMELDESHAYILANVLLQILDNKETEPVVEFIPEFSIGAAESEPDDYDGFDDMSTIGCTCGDCSTLRGR